MASRKTLDQDFRPMAIHDPLAPGQRTVSLFAIFFPVIAFPRTASTTVARNIMQRYPSQNDAGVPGSGANNLIMSLAGPFDSDAFSGSPDTNVKRH